ncbi:MAG TPA: SgcJ/EcaC family oxidoreductase [Blastocatellia bacterium]|nr:SgcJ/EcaC family oxidoreductase [Blastocatellia bacterium]
MKRSPALLSAIVLIGLLAIAQTKTGTRDQGEINNLAICFEDAWNRHDIQTLSALVAEAVDFITVGGGWLKNRKEFEEHHARTHQVQFKESVLTIKKSHIKFIRPDIATAHVEWAMKGDKDPDGTPRQPRQGIFTWVVEKQNGKWLIIAAHNTNLRGLLSPAGTGQPYGHRTVDSC